ncbi:glutamate ABC transporter substrate-binding protein [Demetria terragena]|uniref:glutamate ABC transporter substrate-binding protein n=1 Tax=Demetria terragena TaxID=63959 RepID=UPI0003773333|nr:glutamate ABC transporter substrate-binding protein [Demetria terragena]
MQKTRRMAGVAGLSVVALSLAACGGSENEGGEDGVNVGIKFDQPGLGQKVGSGYEGLDVDVANYVAKDAGLGKVTFKEAPSKQREQLIKSGQVKMVIATYSVTDERKQEVSFAGPYFIAEQALLVAKDSKINGVKSLSGKKLCSVSGSTSATKLKEQVPGVNLQEFDTYSKCASALSTGQIDAMTTDDTILSGYAQQDSYKGKFKVVKGVGGDEIYGIGIKKGDTALCKKVNTSLQKMVDSGEWKKSVEKHLGAEYQLNAEKNPPKQETCS